MVVLLPWLAWFTISHNCSLALAMVFVMIYGHIIWTFCKFLIAGDQSRTGGRKRDTTAAGRNKTLAYNKACRWSPTFEKNPKNTVPKAATMRPML
jgi:hypothetical protein